MIFLAFGIEICYNKIVFCNYVVLKKRCKKWQYEKMDYYDPKLGTGLRRTEHYVRRTFT